MSARTIQLFEGATCEVVHGDHCVGVVNLSDKTPGLVLTPESARHLAVVLIEQAAASERSVDDD